MARTHEPAPGGGSAAGGLATRTHGPPAIEPLPPKYPAHPYGPQPHHALRPFCACAGEEKEPPHPTVTNKPLYYKTLIETEYSLSRYTFLNKINK